MLKYYDRGWNPLFGCCGQFAGCDHCYAAEQMLKRGFSTNFREVCINRKQLHRDFVEGEVIGICTQSDLFQDGLQDGFIDGIIRKCALSTRNTFMTVTKFTDNMLKYFNDPGLPDRLSRNGFSEVSLDNIAFGATICCADDLYRLDDIHNTNMIKHRFLAFEPLLEDVSKYLDVMFFNGIEWIIVGAETGENATPCEIEWIESIVGLADKANIPVFVNAVNVNGRLVTEVKDKPEALRRNECPYNGNRQFRLTGKKHWK